MIATEMKTNNGKALVAAIVAIAMILCAFAVVSSTVDAEEGTQTGSTITVGTTTGAETLDAAIASASSGDVIVLPVNGEYVLSGQTINKILTIQSGTADTQVDITIKGQVIVQSSITFTDVNFIDGYGPTPGYVLIDLNTNTVQTEMTANFDNISFDETCNQDTIYVEALGSKITVNVTGSSFANGAAIVYSTMATNNATINFTETENINLNFAAGGNGTAATIGNSESNINLDTASAASVDSINIAYDGDGTAKAKIVAGTVITVKNVNVGQDSGYATSPTNNTGLTVNGTLNATDMNIESSVKVTADAKVTTTNIENNGSIEVAGSLHATTSSGSGSVIATNDKADVSGIDVNGASTSNGADVAAMFDQADIVTYTGSTDNATITLPADLGTNQELRFINDQVSNANITITIDGKTAAIFGSSGQGAKFSATGFYITSGSVKANADTISGPIYSGTETVDISGKLTGNVTLAFLDNGVNHFVIPANSQLDLNGFTLSVQGNVTLTAYGGIVDNNTSSTGSIVINQYGTLEYTAIDSDISITNNGTMKIAEGFGVENNIRTDLVLEDTDNYLTGRTVIQEGATLTIGRNAALDLNGFELVVYGTLVIERNGTINSTGNVVDGIAVGGISLMSSGAIQNNNGIIGTDKQIKISNGEESKDDAEQSVAMQGVSGVSISLVRSLNGAGERVYNMAVSGDISRISGVDVHSLTITNVDITADMTVGSDVEITVNGATVAKGVTLNHNGAFMTIKTNGLYLTNGATAVFNSPVDGTVSLETGFVGDNTGTVDTPEYVQIEFTGTNTTEPEGVVGMTVTVDRVTYPDPNNSAKSIVEQRAYISGTLGVKSVDDVSNTDTFVNVNLNGTLYVADALYVPEEVKIAATASGSYVFDVSAGTITAETADALNYIGAYYSVENTGNNNQKVTTHYYTSFDNAMGAIADAVNTTIILSGEIDITGTYELTGEQSIENKDKTSAVTIKDGAQITVGTDANIDNNAIYTIEGRVIVTEGVGYRPSATIGDHYVYAVKTTAEDNTTTYSGFKVAMDNVSSGETITVVGDAKYDGNLVIPEGVTVDIDAQMDLYVTGNVTVETGGKLILDLGSTLTVGKDQRDSTVTVAGELDASEGGDIVAYSKAADTSAGTPAEAAKSVKVYSTGTSTFAANKTFAAPVTMNAAYYDDGERVFTTVAAAVAYAQENALIKVNATGVFSESGAVSSNGVDIVIADGADVTLGNVTLNDAYIGPSNNGKYTATVSGLSGAGDAATTSTVSVTKTTATVTSIVTLNAEGVNQYALSINAIVGATTVSAGTVVYADDSMSVNRGNSLTISAGATLLIAEGDSVQITNTPTSQTYYLINEGTIQIDGDVTTVDLALPGTVVIAATGGITAESLVVTGDVTVEADGTLSVSVSLQVGESPEYLGSAATGSISGEISLNDSAYAIVFAGASIADATFDAVNQPETTQFTVNGIVLADVYTVAGSTAAMTAVNSAVMGCDDLENYNNSGAIPIVWKDGENTINPVTIGDYAVLNTERGYKDVGIVISIGSNITLSVDNVIVGSAYNGFEYPLSIGTHTVSAIVNPGFTGEITITFNGQTIVNGGTIEVTADMIDSGVVLSAIGQLTQDSTVVIDGGSSDDSGMSLTDILLIVLVVLILVMAIIVALRLMRS